MRRATARVPMLALALLCLVSTPRPSAAQDTTGARVEALIGLARAARDQGRIVEAAARFAEADRLRSFDGPLLVEYFWSEVTADRAEADAVGRRVLAADPRHGAVRDGLIGWAVRAGLEARVRDLADGGARLEPRQALWSRRLGEHFLRVGRPAEAAEAFARAASQDGGGARDLAQRALAVEASGDVAAARAAWSAVPDDIRALDPAWQASRTRAFAPRPLAVPRPLTEAEQIAAARRQLERTPCAEAPLRRLAALADRSALTAAVQARPVTCGAHASWVSLVAEGLIGEGRFGDALSLASGVAAIDVTEAILELRGVLLQWTGDDRAAEPVLAGLVDRGGAPARAVAALVDARRALGDIDAAWAVAARAWSSTSDVMARVTLAELAIDTGRIDEALALATDLVSDEIAGDRAQVVRGRALLALGRTAEARAMLEPYAATASAALPWLEAVAATDGAAAALGAAARLGVDESPRWTEVGARLAEWHADLGHDREASHWLDVVQRHDAARARVLRAALSLGAGRPGDALLVLDGLEPPARDALVALDLRATALAEQARWDEAFAVLADLRARRPHVQRWAVQEAEWRHRRMPSASTLATLETVASRAGDLDAARSLARGYLLAGQFERAVEAARRFVGPTAADADRVLLARGLRGAGRLSAALSALESRPATTPEAMRLHGELTAAVHGPETADATFRALVGRPDATPAWYLAWADIQTDATRLVEVLEAGAARFPSDPTVQERLAVSAHAVGRADLASSAAGAALAIEPSRTGAWFVAVERALIDRSPTVPTLLSRFEAAVVDRPDVRIDMAHLIAGRGRGLDDAAIRRALGWLDAILGADPANARALVAQARARAAVGETPLALDSLDAAVALRPDMAEALKLRAEILTEHRAYGDAVRALDAYLAVVPGDEAARRQQARIEGWRGDYGAASRRYAELLSRVSPASAGVAAEAAAKAALHGGRWGEARRRYDAWLAVEPDDVEARFERAQLFDRLGEPGRARDAYAAVAARFDPNPTAAAAATRVGRRERVAADLFTTTHSANAAERQQLLDLVDAGAGVSDDLGFGPGTRARLYGGPSFAQGQGRSWSGHHVGGQVSALVAPSLRLSGGLAYRQLGDLDPAWFGDAQVNWRALPTLRVLGGVERSLLLENGVTLADGIRGVGPTAGVRWTPSTDLRLELSGARQGLSDGNRRDLFRASASGRVHRGVNEVWLHAWSEHQGFSDARPDYFTPASFWRHDVGAEWRRWLALPRFFGDRERWVSAAYLFGLDNRREVYHTTRIGLSWELANGVSLVGDGQLIRSGVYDGTRITVGLRLRQSALPE